MFINRFKPLLTQFVTLAVFSLGLMFIDSRSHTFSFAKQYISAIADPFYSFAALPEQTSTWLGKWFSDRQLLQQSMDKISLENSLLKVKIQEIQSDIDHFKNINELSESAADFAQKMIPGKIIEVSIQHQSQKLVINKGHYDHVYLGQPVIDGDGILGQVTELSVRHSIITLLTDASQSIPVLVKRNRLRALVYGIGYENRLIIRYLGTDADIKAGDELVSSGIGGRYPSGYPVAQVTQVVKDDNEAFLQVSAKPLAKINHGERVLLIWPVFEGKPNRPNLDIPANSISGLTPGLY